MPFLRLGQTRTSLLDCDQLVHWMITPEHGLSLTLGSPAAQTVLFIIWTEKNNWLHNGSSSPPLILFKKLDRLLGISSCLVSYPIAGVKVFSSSGLPMHNPANSLPNFVPSWASISSGVVAANDRDKPPKRVELT
ncbi:hypothetical protein HID58_028751 [Brassica napus]|uniref:Uncharacterized protein n=1 Tax=Brassica napus TaxID=3708 RepID=A0ABQ8CD19_BRANA|nr:hypothetical protein HID58_028751 [Brassica napus]